MVSVQARIADKRIDAEREAEAAEDDTQNPSSVSRSFLYVGEHRLSAVWTDHFSSHISKNEQARSSNHDCIAV